MHITEPERRFLARRTRLIHAWRYVGPLVVGVIVGLGAGLAWLVPMLANPAAVFARLANDAIPPSTMALSTAILPIVVLMCLLLALVMVLLAFVALANERKYLAIIERLVAGQSGGDAWIL